MSFLQKVSTSMVIILFTTILVMDVFVQPEYSFDDSPYFDYRSGFLLLAIVGVVLITAGIMKFGEKIKWNLVCPILFYVFSSLTILFLVPMEPVSDQATVFFLATNKLYDPFGYMIVNINVLPTILYVYGLVKLFGASIWVQKIANVVLGLFTLILTAKIYGLLSSGNELEQKKPSKLFFTETESKLLWIGALFLPAFFYNNHIYNEVPSVTLAVLMLYLVIRDDNAIWLRVITVIVSCLQFVLRQSGIILVIAVAMYIFFYQKKRVYAVIYFMSVIAGYLLIEKWYTVAMVGDGAQGYPVWSFIRMGMNEAEFGFQDHSHTSDATFWDCVDRYKEYGLYKVLTIYGKKIFWIWGEGTYQSGRYGLGYPDNTYTYDTFVTALISESPDRLLRIAINMVLRAQYLLYMFFAVIGTLRAQKKPKLSVLFFIICGFFLFFVIWEIKSRYLYGLYPIFLLLGMYGWESEDNPVKKIPERIKNRVASK